MKNKKNQANNKDDKYSNPVWVGSVNAGGNFVGHGGWFALYLSRINFRSFNFIKWDSSCPSLLPSQVEVLK